jgi:hypothetical protein
MNIATTCRASMFDGSEYTPADFARMMTTFASKAPKMDAGTAVHAVIETAGFSELKDGPSKGWHVKFDLDAELRMPAMRERSHYSVPTRHNALWPLRCNGCAYRP